MAYLEIPTDESNESTLMCHMDVPARFEDTALENCRGVSRPTADGSRTASAPGFSQGIRDR
jgi:hypothetical protein